MLLNSCGISNTKDEESIGEWKSTGLEGVRVFELKEASGYLYASVAGTTIGLFMKSIELNEWQYSQGSITGAWLGIQALAINPANPNQIWLGSADDRTTAQLKRSEDHGESWELVKNIGSVTEFIDVVHDVEIHPENGNIYLCLESKFAVSHDDGETWPSVDNLENEEGEEISVGCSSIQINPANPDELFLSGSTMIFSKDAGETWEVIPEPDRNTIIDFHVDWERRIVYASLLNPDMGVYTFNF